MSGGVIVESQAPWAKFLKCGTFLKGLLHVKELSLACRAVLCRSSATSSIIKIHCKMKTRAKRGKEYWVTYKEDTKEPAPLRLGCHPQ